MKSMTPGVERCRKKKRTRTVPGVGGLIRGILLDGGLSGEVVGGEGRAGRRGGTKGKEVKLDSSFAPVPRA